ncbi:hypothetical protein N7468_006296 [Penicillium chermesinum]|uniref:Uncharacterized protein n=1 Tax=Penicillium chermesinum TaxID=63820 RepID=A0A9W9NSP5_9EURO|nr:uncharacterized protein N7468_006296 [Penicillium chermesinum]KAJ5225071.1 hypothetical protein N7468_006296 [Penicillium chermesinum]
MEYLSVNGQGRLLRRRTRAAPTKAKINEPDNPSSIIMKHHQHIHHGGRRPRSPHRIERQRDIQPEKARAVRRIASLDEIFIPSIMQVPIMTAEIQPEKMHKIRFWQNRDMARFATRIVIRRGVRDSRLAREGILAR